MGWFIDLTGQRFGRWTVLKRVKGKRANAAWLCRCDCGTESSVYSDSLRSGKSKSCGCLRDEETSKRQRLPDGEAAFNSIVEQYRRQAAVRGYEWHLTRSDVRRLTKQTCSYCGCPPSQVRRRSSLRGDYVYNGIDRVDSDAGYTLENCVSCCGTCNRAKRNMSAEEFLSWVSRVWHYQERASDAQ